MIDPFDSYKMYNALKLHFETDGYDAIKYNYKSNASPKAFMRRKDKYFFAKLAKNYDTDLLTYYVSNFKMGVGYVGDMINESGERNYKDHKRIQESIHRVFSVDINNILLTCEDFDKLLISEDGQLPLVIKLWLREEISLESVVILNAILGFVKRETKNINDTIMWPDTKRKIEKYSPFVNFSRNKCISLLQKTFTNA